MTFSDQIVLTPNGHSASFLCRDGTVDANIAISLNIWDNQVCDEYRMRGRPLSGWAIDVGAHIGSWAIPAALDNPDLRVIAIEVVPESADLIEQNAQRNGVADRVTVVRKAAAGPHDESVTCHWGYRGDETVSDGYAAAHRLIAGTWDGRLDPEFIETLGAVSLDALMAEHGIEDVAFIKIDCEACEWQFLDTPAVGKVAVISGEYHGRPNAVDPVRRLDELLGATHVVTARHPEMGLGLFEAVRR